MAGQFLDHFESGANAAEQRGGLSRPSDRLREGLPDMVELLCHAIHEGLQ